MYTVLPTCIQRADGASIPPDPANTDYAAYLEWLAAGNIPDFPPPTPHPVLVEQAKERIREERQPILLVLSDLQSTANTLGEQATAQVIEAAKQALRDLTKIDLSGCETLDEMKAAVLARYAEIASASPALKAAFSQAMK